MADTAITLVTQGINIPHRQVEIPNYVSGVVALADTNYHALVIDGRGKRALTVHVVNETNKDVAVTVFGAYASDDDPGDANVVELGGSGESGFTASATSQNYETYYDPFPFYIVRLKAATTPNGSNVTVYGNLMSN